MVIVVVAAYIADLIFGDPEKIPHPVRWMGKLIGFLDHRLRPKSHQTIERMAGTILAVLVVGVSALFAYLIFKFSTKLNIYFGMVVSVWLGYTTLSIRDLKEKAMGVLCAMKAKDLSAARRELSKIVGRDTQHLNEKEIVRATVESIAENTNDGIVAPLFYLVLGGPALAIAYKAINTLDSMVGYRSQGYLHFGWASARLDDLVNFIPARISGLLICLAGPFLGGKFLEGIKVMLADGRKHPSPNSGISEAAMAGALRAKLGGPCAYRGQILERSHLGVDSRNLEPILIKEAQRISFIVSLMMVMVGTCIRLAI